MSTSIYGFVEVKLFDDDFGDWFMVVDSCAILTGNYDFMGCLFGIRNPSNFAPLFADRGLPDDCCDEIVRFFNEGDYYSPTWCSYAELLKIDPTEKALLPDQRVHVIYEGMEIKAYPKNDKEKALAKIMTRGEALQNPGFEILLELMEVLAKRYGNDGVRWVVYFD